MGLSPEEQAIDIYRAGKAGKEAGEKERRERKEG